MYFPLCVCIRVSSYMGRSCCLFRYLSPCTSSNVSGLLVNSCGHSHLWIMLSQCQKGHLKIGRFQTWIHMLYYAYGRFINDNVSHFYCIALPVWHLLQGLWLWRTRGIPNALLCFSVVGKQMYSALLCVRITGLFQWLLISWEVPLCESVSTGWWCFCCWFYHSVVVPC